MLCCTAGPAHGTRDDPVPTQVIIYNTKCRQDMVHSAFSVSVRVFSEEMFVSIVCFQILVVRAPELKGMWGTATIFLSLKPGIPKVGSGITSKILGY